MASLFIDKGRAEVAYPVPPGVLVQGQPLGPAYFRAVAGIRAPLPFSPYRGLRGRERERAEAAKGGRERERERGYRGVTLEPGGEQEEGKEEGEEEEEEGDEEGAEEGGDLEVNVTAAARDGDEPDDCSNASSASIGTLGTAASLSVPLLSVPGGFTFSHAPGAVLPKGTHTLVAKFVPQDAAAALFYPSYAKATVCVGPPPAALVWPPLPALYFGFPLGPSQLKCALVPSSDPRIPTFYSKTRVRGWGQGQEGEGQGQAADDADPSLADPSTPTPTPSLADPPLPVEQRMRGLGSFSYSPPEGALLPVGQVRSGIGVG